jgi:hypothetical protein
MWCSAPVGANNINELYIKDYVPPTTATRLISGITILASETAGAINLAIDTDSTKTKQEAVTNGGCGKGSQITKLNTKG